MNKAIKNKRPLILSVVSILLSVVLLVGATVAWFTDTETNKNNRIAAGTLDVMLYMYYMGTDADANVAEPTAPTSWDDITVATVLADLTAGTWYQITDATPADCIFYFDNEVWQPGDEQEIYLAVRNAGTLALDYTLDFVVADEALADALQLAYTNAVSTDALFAFPSAPEYSTASTYYKTLSSYTTTTAERGTVISGVTQETTLAASAVDYISLDIRLDESTGDTYQAAAFAMDVILTATQQDQTGTVVKAYSAADITGADANQTVILMQNITATEEIELTDYVNIDLNGYTITGDVTYTIEGTVPGTIDIGTLGETGGITGDLTVSAPYGTVNHYGTYSGTVTITQVADHSYNLYATPADGSSAVSIEAGTLNVYVEDTESSTTSITMGGDAVVNDERPATTTTTDEEGNTTTTTNTATLSVTTTEDATGTFNDARESDETSGEAAPAANVEITEGASVSINNSDATTDSVELSGAGDYTILVSGDEDALVKAMTLYPDATVFSLAAGTYTAPTEITSSVTITGAGSTRLGSTSVTTLTLTEPLKMRTNNTSLTLESLDLDADIENETFDFNSNTGIIQLGNYRSSAAKTNCNDTVVTGLALTIIDCYTIQESTSVLNSAIALIAVQDTKITVDNSFLHGEYTFFCMSYMDEDGVRGTTQDIENTQIDITDSTLSGWAAGNMRGINTVYTATNCILDGTNSNSGTWNSYATFVMTDGSIGGTYTFTDCTLIATNDGDQAQNCFNFQYGATDNTLILNNCSYEINESNDVFNAVIKVSQWYTPTETNGYSSTYTATKGSTVIIDDVTYELPDNVNVYVDKDTDLADYYIIDDDGKLVAYSPDDEG